MEDNILKVENYIGGSFFSTENYIDSFNPSTGKVFAQIPDSGQAEVDLAVAAAKSAFPIWSTMSQNERSALLLKVADLIEKNLHQLALEESLDQGKTLVQATSLEMPRAALNFRHFGTYGQHTVETANLGKWRNLEMLSKYEGMRIILMTLKGIEHKPMEKSKIQNEFGALSYTARTAVGVAGLISPWNLPLYLLTFKIAPAIAAGNTVVCKPSEMTSVTAWRLCSFFNQAGIPAGVVNMVFGYGHKAGEALVKHPDVPLISFTGSTVTGKRINTLAAEYFKKVSLEMGGKNSGIVFADADLEKCIPTMIRSSFMNQGEVCLTTSRIFVHREIFELYVQKFLDATREGIRVGPPLDAESTMGALISTEHLAKVRSYVNIAEAEGAKLLIGKEILQLPNNFRDGYFMNPVVITDISDNSRCMQEEIFGPVVCIVPFDTEEEVIVRSNNVKYGLCASVWSEDVGRIHRVVQKLEVGTVWANCWLVRCLAMPFGGMKESGIGREGSHDSWEFFTQAKTVCVKYT